MIKLSYVLLITAILLPASCATVPHRLSGKTDIPLLLPGDRYASWTKDQTSFDDYHYYMISKYSPTGKSILILAEAPEDEEPSTATKKVMIPEIGMVGYRRRSTGGDVEAARFQTDAFTRDDGHGGKVSYFVRVNTDDGDQEAMLKAVRWAAPGTAF